MNKSAPTIQDIARESGFSLGTVSQALRNMPGVSAETRARVIEVAQALGYQRQIRVATPTHHQVSTVGLLMKRNAGTSMKINPFYSYVLAGTERECQRQNLSLMYANMEVDDENQALDWPPMLENEQVDGILVVGAFLKDTITRIGEQSNKIIVLVDAYAPFQRFDSIVSDNLNGAYQAVSYLIEQGHTKIGLVGSTPHAYPSIRERRKGYTRALKEYGIRDTYIKDSPLTRDAVYESTLHLLRNHPEVTAIFACNDEVAAAAMSAANELGLSIPEDISIVGFDDIDLAQEITPTLTTIHVDKTLMGVLAVRHLLDRAENPERTSITTVVGTQLIIRESVRSKRKS